MFVILESLKFSLSLSFFHSRSQNSEDRNANLHSRIKLCGKCFKDTFSAKMRSAKAILTAINYSVLQRFKKGNGSQNCKNCYAVDLCLHNKCISVSAAVGKE